PRYHGHAGPRDVSQHDVPLGHGAAHAGDGTGVPASGAVALASSAVTPGTDDASACEADEGSDALGGVGLPLQARTSGTAARRKRPWLTVGGNVRETERPHWSASASRPCDVVTSVLLAGRDRD